MKKTVTANISGIVFHIDEDAYDKLNLYLARIREKLATEEGRDEILSDIEGRIAEMFQEKLNTSKKVITIDDVKEVIGQLGEPEQFESTEGETQSNSQSNYYEERTEKRLYRDPDDKYIAGVSGGLGAFFNIDPIWMRIGFVVTTFIYGFGPILYIILWIVVPKARTTAEKLEMRGRKVNLSNIEKTIKDELNDLKKNFKEFSEETKQHFKKKENFKQARNKTASVAADILRALSKVVGVVLILVTFAMIVALISGLYMVPFGIHESTGIWLLSVPEILGALLSSQAWIQATLAALILIIGIPLLWILLAGIRLLFEIKTSSKYLAAFTFILWLAAAGTLALAAVNGVRNFSAEHTVHQENDITTSDWPNIYLKLDEQILLDSGIDQGRNSISTWQMMWSETGNTAMGKPELRIKKSNNDLITLEIIKESRGISPTQARINTESIQYNFLQTDSLLILNPVFYFEKEAGWRNQEVKLELYLPENKIAVLEKNLQRSMRVRYDEDVVRVLKQ